MSVRYFWYHSNDTKRNPWVVLCLHCPINNSSVYLGTTVTFQLCYKPLGTLQRVTNSQKVHISSHDGSKKFITSTLLDIGPKASQRRSRVAEITPSPIKNLEQRILRYDWPRDFSAMTKENKLQTTLKNWTMFTRMSQPFTSIYNNRSHSDKNPVLILLLIFFFLIVNLPDG